jgi:hypothetical protein
MFIYVYISKSPQKMFHSPQSRSGLLYVQKLNGHEHQTFPFLVASLFVDPTHRSEVSALSLTPTAYASLSQDVLPLTSKLDRCRSHRQKRALSRTFESNRG